MSKEILDKRGLMELRKKIIVENEFLDPKQVIIIGKSPVIVEDLSDYFSDFVPGVRFLHWEVDPSEANVIERRFANGLFKVLIVTEGYLQRLSSDLNKIKRYYFDEFSPPTI